MPLQAAFSPQQAARIAAAAYLITNATAEFNLFLGALYILMRFLFPESIETATATVMALPTIALVLIGLVLVPIFSFEFTIGFWLLVKGVRAVQGSDDPPKHACNQTRFAQ